MQQINKITQPFPEILVLYCFGECWACLGMPDQTQQIFHYLNKGSMAFWLHAKKENYTSNSFWDINV